jgi:tetratricopeptide (TPR) repeat protein
VLLAIDKPAEAQKKYEEGNRIAADLVEKSEKNLSFLRILSISEERIGDSLQRQGKLQCPADDGSDCAFKRYEKYFKNARKLVDEDRTNIYWQRDLAFSLQRMGDLGLEIGDRKVATSAFEQCLKVLDDFRDELRKSDSETNVAQRFAQAMKLYDPRNNSPEENILHYCQRRAAALKK